MVEREFLHLFASDNINVSSHIRLPSQRYYEDAELGAPWWISLELENHSVEGILHLVNQSELKKLIIFEPGFPGDGSTRLERLHVNTLLKSGFSVFATRHNSTIINGKYSENYLNCVERQTEAITKNQELLGVKGQVSINEWINEPVVSISLLESIFKEIYLIGHSFGALAILNSLIYLRDASFKGIDKIARVISLSGATGRVSEIDDPILVQWKKYLDSEWTRERVKIGETDRNLEILRNAYLLIHEKAGRIPEWIDVIHVSPWGDNLENLDELVSPLQALDFIATLGRGSLVIDKTQKSDDSGRMVHDMDNLRTETLIEFLNGHLSSNGSHLAILK